MRFLSQSSITALRTSKLQSPSIELRHTTSQDGARGSTPRTTARKPTRRRIRDAQWGSCHSLFSCRGLLRFPDELPAAPRRRLGSQRGRGAGRARRLTIDLGGEPRLGEVSRVADLYALVDHHPEGLLQPLEHARLGRGVQHLAPHRRVVRAAEDEEDLACTGCVHGACMARAWRMMSAWGMVHGMCMMCVQIARHQGTKEDLGVGLGGTGMQP